MDLVEKPSSHADAAVAIYCFPVDHNHLPSFAPRRGTWRFRFRSLSISLSLSSVPASSLEHHWTSPSVPPSPSMSLVTHRLHQCLRQVRSKLLHCLVLSPSKTRRIGCFHPMPARSGHCRPWRTSSLTLCQRPTSIPPSLFLVSAAHREINDRESPMPLRHGDFADGFSVFQPAVLWPT